MTVTIGLGEVGSVNFNEQALNPNGTLAGGLDTGTGAIKKVSNAFSGLSTAPTAGVKLGKGLDSVIPNALEDYSSYNALWTLAALTPEQFNNPETYRDSIASFHNNIVFSSAGRFDSQRVKTYHGQPEYYVNDFTMSSVITADPKAGNSNVITFKFNIFEPYSMGIFLESLQLAAMSAGYPNYTAAVFVLRLDFAGFDGEGLSITTVKPKFFAIKLGTVKFKVTEAGSTYAVTALPFNQIGHSEVFNNLYSDLKLTHIKGGTVAALLNGDNGSKEKTKSNLQQYLNDIEADLVKAKRIGIPDQYVIEFPKSSVSTITQSPTGKLTVTPGSATPKSVGSSGSDTPATNSIAISKMKFSDTSGGILPMKEFSDLGIINAKGMPVKGMCYDPGSQVFQFPSGKKITDVITQVILHSEYVEKIVKDDKPVNDMIKYFMIDIQIKLLEYDVLVADYAKKITFRVTPYLVHKSVFANANSSVGTYDQQKRTAAKAYNYMYTGQNTDIIKFEIDINNLFFTGARPTPEVRSGTLADPNVRGTTTETKIDNVNLALGGDLKQSNAIRARPGRDINAYRASSGGSGTTTTELLVAQAFHDAFINKSSELISIDLHILGDPFWLVDSGMANHHIEPIAAGSQILADNTMNYISGQVFIYLSFRSPIDINESAGTYVFGNQSSTDSPYGGVYNVIKCESVFANGTFTQKLKCVRMPGQESDSPDQKTPTLGDSGKSSIMEFGDTEASPNSIFGDIKSMATAGMKSIAASITPDFAILK